MTITISSAIWGDLEKIPIPNEIVDFQSPAFFVSDLTGRVGMTFYSKNSQYEYGVWYAERDPTTAQWALEYISGNYSSNPSISLVFDDQDNPFILYAVYDSNTDRRDVYLSYKSLDSTNWVIEHVDNTTDYHDLNVVIEIDSENNLHAIWGKENKIVYGIRKEDTSGWLKYDFDVHNIGFRPQIVPKSISNNESSPIKFYTHLVYIDQSNTLYYYHFQIEENGWGAGGGVIQGTGGEHAKVEPSSTAHFRLDRNGHPLVVAETPSSPYNLITLYKYDNGWTSENIIQYPTHHQSDPALAVAPNGTIFVAWVNPNDNSIHISVRNKKVFPWKEIKVSHEDEIGIDPLLHFKNGVLHLEYWSLSTDKSGFVYDNSALKPFESTTTTTSTNFTAPTTTESTSPAVTSGFTFVTMWLLLIPSILIINFRKKS